MPTVPVYQRTERLRPNLQQGMTTQASGDDFGAGIGRGMGAIGQGLGNVADSFRAVEDLKATMAAKDSLTAMEREKMELDYGANGFLTTQGRNAVEGRNSYNSALEDLKKKYAPADPMAARKFNDAAASVVTQGMRSGIIHSAQGQKDWASSSSTARMELLKDQALVGYNRPEEVKKSLGLGFAEIGAQAELMGWDQAVVELKRKEFSSSVHSSVALAIASKPNGARSALEYIKQNGDAMDVKVKLDMENKLRPFVVDEEGLSVVNEIMSKGRKVSELPDDIVGEVAGVSGKAGGGPTRSKGFLASISAHRDRPGDTMNLDDAFADNLAALIEDAPAHIKDGLGLGSAYRSNERQKVLFENSDKTGRTVAYPAGYEKPDGSIARGSNHLHGRAVDLTYKGTRLDKAPKEVRDWVHQNAANYGLRFPMSYEPWHIEPIKGGTVVPARDGVSARSTMPSYGEAMDRINQITDPDVRASAFKQLNAQFEMRSKAESADASAAKSEIWTLMLQNTPLSQIPLDLKIAAGREAVSGFMEFESKAGDVKTDPTAYSSLNNMAAADPANFAQLDLTAPEIINSLSREDWKALSNKKSSILGDEAKAVQDGKVYVDAFKQSEQALAAAGLTATGIQASNTRGRQEMEQRIAAFQNSLRVEIDQFRTQSGKTPGYDEVQSMVNALLLKSIYQEQRGDYSPMRLFDDGFSQSDGGFMFERGNAPEGSTVKPVVEYEKIPADWLVTIRQALTERNGKAPSREEVEAEYSAVIMDVLGVD